MNYNDFYNKLHHAFIMQENEFDLAKAFEIASKMCPQTLKKEQIKKITIEVLNAALDDGLIKEYNGLYESSLTRKTKIIVSEFRKQFESMTNEEQIEFLKKYGFSFGDETGVEAK